jgi:hypothetical protein
LKDVVINQTINHSLFIFTYRFVWTRQAAGTFYKLGGIDDEWHALGNQGMVGFSFPARGKIMHLGLREICSNGFSSTNEIAVNILVRAPFYKTSWFLALCAGLFLTIIYGMAHYRITR